MERPRAKVTVCRDKTRLRAVSLNRVGTNTGRMTGQWTHSVGTAPCTCGQPVTRHRRPDRIRSDHEHVLQTPAFGSRASADAREKSAACTFKCFGNIRRRTRCGWWWYSKEHLLIRRQLTARGPTRNPTHPVSNRPHRAPALDWNTRAPDGNELTGRGQNVGKRGRGKRHDI